MLIFLPLAMTMLLRAIFGKKPVPPQQRKMLVLDMAYTLEMILKHQLVQSITCRDLDNYFEHVWSCHPCATVIPPEKKEETYGAVVETKLAPRHTFLEGKVGRHPALEKWPALNFILSQWHIYFYLNHLIEREKITVIRAGEPYYPSLMGLAIAKANGLPLLMRIPSNYDEIYKTTGKPATPRLFKWRFVEKIIERFTLPLADLVAGANQDNLNFALANGARKEYSTVFRYGNLINSVHRMDPKDRPDPTPLLEELGLSGRRFAIYIGRLEKVKLPDHVLRVTASVKKSGRELAALLVGDGQMKDELVKLSRELGIETDIIFAGNRNQQWLASVIPAAYVVVSPHTGRALTEAAFSGVPVVAYDIDWQPEIIRSGETGELVKYGDFESMAAAVIRYIDDPEYAAEMGANVRAAILEMMDPVRLNNHERNEYDKLLARFYDATGSDVKG